MCCRAPTAPNLHPKSPLYLLSTLNPLPMLQSPQWTPQFKLFTLQGDGLQPARERGCHWAQVVECSELLTDPEGAESTRLVRLDIANVSARALSVYMLGPSVF